MSLASTRLLRYLLVGVPCARSLAPVDWHSLATAPTTSLNILPGTFLREEWGAELAHLQETNLTTSAASHHSDSEHEHRHTSVEGTEKMSVKYSGSADAVTPPQVHLISIHSHSKHQRGNQARHQDINEWHVVVVVVIIAGVCMALILLVIRATNHRAEGSKTGSAAAVLGTLLDEAYQNPAAAAQNFLPSQGTISSVPTSSHLHSSSVGGSPGNGARSPAVSQLQPNQVSQVFIINGSILPKAQSQTIMMVRTSAGEAVAKIVFDEGRPGEVELDGHHGILLEIPPRSHVAFLDTSKVHNKVLPLVTVLPWHDPPDPSADPLAIVQADQHGGFEVHQGGKITLVVPMHQRNGAIKGVFEYTDTGAQGRCLATLAWKSSATGVISPGSHSSISLSVAQGVDATLILSLVISILKLGGRVGREGALGSAADQAQNMFNKITGQ